MLDRIRYVREYYNFLKIPNSLKGIFNYVVPIFFTFLYIWIYPCLRNFASSVTDKYNIQRLNSRKENLKQELLPKAEEENFRKKIEKLESENRRKDVEIDQIYLKNFPYLKYKYKEKYKTDVESLLLLGNPQNGILKSGDVVVYDRVNNLFKYNELKEYVQAKEIINFAIIVDLLGKMNNLYVLSTGIIDLNQNYIPGIHYVKDGIYTVSKDTGDIEELDISFEEYKKSDNPENLHKNKEIFIMSKNKIISICSHIEINNSSTTVVREKEICDKFFQLADA